ncbi:hypothetical protein CR513_32521, partial [Mucuna pruriens]
MRRNKEPRKAPLDTLKCKILPFVGYGDVESYLELEMKVDQVLKCFNYDDYVKVRMVTYKFSIYTLVWWNQYIKEVRKDRIRHIDTWLDLRRETRTRFVPASYSRDLYNKLWRMYQGSKSVEEYYKDMEVALMRANMLESNEATMAQFLHDLNKEIHDVVELYHYTCLDDLVHKATRVESQQRRRLASKIAYPNDSSNWKGKEREKEWLKKDKNPKKESSILQGQKEDTPTNLSSLSKSSNIKCLKFLWKGAHCLSMPQQESSSNSKVESSSYYSHDEGDFFMVRSLMNIQVKEDSDSQRKKIFHSNCHVKGKLYSIIIYGGSYVNVASLRLLEKPIPGVSRSNRSISTQKDPSRLDHPFPTESSFKAQITPKAHKIPHLMHTSHSCSRSIPSVMHDTLVRCLVDRGGTGLKSRKLEHAESVYVCVSLYELEPMENNDQTLKELTMPDVVYQPWCIQYLQLEPVQSYELKSSLIHLLPKFHGLVGEDPHKHLKEFHVACSTMRP